MEIPLFDSDKIPQPRENIKLEDLRATPYPDRFRVFLEIKVTPFRDRPNLIVVMRDANGKLVSELNIIETMHSDMEFTLHIRNVSDPAGVYTLTTDLFFETRNPPQDTRTITFEIPSLSETED